MPDTCQGPGRPGPLVTLNVGGKLYSTTLETLTRFPDSMLGAMFRGPQPALLDSCGNYFIDRDGKTFRHVLNFLRFGRLDLPEGYAELSLLRAEADFYQIRPLLHQLQRVEAERWRQRSNAVLHADVDLNSRRLHFNVRRGPQNYELSSCTVEIFTANVFCTDRHFLAVLRRYLGHLDCANGNVEEGSPHLCLEWAPCPAALPAAEYAKQKLRRLWVDGREIRSSNEFLEEVLKVALAQGFRVDSVFPDPADILNARSLRFVRH
ncbi:BTB/POZ domain-containing protein KCTD11 [Protobothrops mucrosquamatus]|uniref:BTB/POZ domain-containing protein KCTD11 n=1 Tax=Protobothrops mucrosquamatus TaxID=103944 RepID=UPI0010FB29A1|nr:BTB/POZ domain-containing protein KCTD11 [Protobothrops mucrosquamatus]